MNLLDHNARSRRRKENPTSGKRSAGRPGPQQVQTGSPPSTTPDDSIATRAVAGRGAPRTVHSQAKDAVNLGRPPHVPGNAKTRRQTRSIQGFKAYSLTSDRVRVALVPELGARLISLKDLRTGREWLWHPAAGLKLFRNECGDNFANSPLVGLDECLPTIAPCSWRERNLPDHGEIWTAATKVDLRAWADRLIRTSVSLRISPFDFERTIELCGNEVRLTYHLKNRAASEQPYLWAMHPLIELQSGDELELPASTRALLNGAACLDSLTSGPKNGECIKVFASKISEGWAAINNARTGDRLRFDWNPAPNDTLGLWLNRGGWHGHHHFALEPSNGEPDALSAAAQNKRCGVLAPHASVTWLVCIRVGN